MVLVAHHASAQTKDDGTAEALTIAAATVPRTETSAAFQRLAARAGSRSEVTYAKDITGDLPLDEAYRPPAGDAARGREPLLGGPVAMIVVFALLFGVAALWLRFGGSGMLLSGTPGEIKAKATAPDGWRIADDADLQAGDLLAQIAAMPDRRAALVRLLRHCLLQAGHVSGTRFARSDTEREAFRRLPVAWSGRSGLSGILTATELAHYGGRPVSDDSFADSLTAARAILTTSRGAHA